MTCRNCSGDVSGDDELEWRGAKREHKAGEYVRIVKRGRTEQRTAAQEWNDAVLWQYITVLVGRLRDKKKSLVKHHREWAEVAAALQNSDGLRDRMYQEPASAQAPKPRDPEPLSACERPQPVFTLSPSNFPNRLKAADGK